MAYSTAKLKSRGTYPEAEELFTLGFYKNVIDTFLFLRKFSSFSSFSLEKLRASNINLGPNTKLNANFSFSVSPN
jgi:hypothetical protein